MEVQYTFNVVGRLIEPHKSADFQYSEAAVRIVTCSVAHPCYTVHLVCATNTLTREIVIRFIWKCTSSETFGLRTRTIGHSGARTVSISAATWRMMQDSDGGYGQLIR